MKNFFEYRFLKSERQALTIEESLLKRATESTEDNAAEINEEAGKAMNAKLISHAVYSQIHALLTRER